MALEQVELLPDEQKGQRKEKRGTKNQLLIDKTVKKNCKRRLTNLAIELTDSKKVYMITYSWIMNDLKMFGVA